MNAKLLRLLAGLLLAFAAYADDMDPWPPEDNTTLDARTPAAVYAAPESGTYTTIGPNTFGPNDDAWVQVGPNTFGPDGQSCIQIGPNTICRR